MAERTCSGPVLHDAFVTDKGLRLTARRIAQAIVDGDVPAVEGARRIWTDVWSEAEPGEVDALGTFVNDVTDWDEMPDRRPEIEAHILAEARRLVEQGPRFE